jgi:hypothetical protein
MGLPVVRRVEALQLILRQRAIELLRASKRQMTQEDKDAGKQDGTILYWLVISLTLGSRVFSNYGTCRVCFSFQS